MVYPNSKFKARIRMIPDTCSYRKAAVLDHTVVGLEAASSTPFLVIYFSLAPKKA